jgi:ABC-type transporter MlaC component
MQRTLELGSLGLAALVLLAAPAAHAAQPGKDRTEAFVAAFGKVQVKDGKLDPAQKEANDKAFLALDEFFDFAALTSKPIEPNASKLSPEELVSFKAKFRELLRLTAYPKVGAFFKRATLAWQPEKKVGDQTAVAVKMHDSADDMDVVVEFRWAAGQGGLRLVDVLFDGDSLLKDYQNQISRVITKNGVPGLFKILDERRAALEGAK